jgi:hypothetical protein
MMVKRVRDSRLPNQPLQRTWSSLAPGTTPLNVDTLGGPGMYRRRRCVA